MGGDGVFWDRVACVYDVFANVINRKVNRALCAAVEPWIEPGDEVLECACGIQKANDTIQEAIELYNLSNPAQ